MNCSLMSSCVSRWHRQFAAHRRQDAVPLCTLNGYQRSKSLALDKGQATTLEWTDGLMAVMGLTVPKITQASPHRMFLQWHL